MLGMEDIRVYIDCHQNMVAQYIATHPIMELCLEAYRKPGLRLYRLWWDQPALDILRIKAGHAASEGEEEIGM